MNKFLVGVFLSLYLVALIRPITPYIEYAINKDYIANVLCINKDKPKLQCNGKCHLKSQIKKLNEPNQSDKQTIPLKIELEKYPIGFMQQLDYSEHIGKYLPKSLFAPYLLKVTEYFSDPPTPPPKPFC